jgi:tetratricopeptide (TPR) repeat protein
VATSPAAQAPTKAPLAAAGTPPAVATALPSIPRAADEPRKALAASARHVDTTDPTPATLRAPAARHGTPVAALDPRASKSAPSAPSVPPAALVDTTAILDRGQSAFDRGDYQEAIRQGRHAIAAGAEINGRLLVGDVYFHLERYREAVREYNAALARDPADASARRRRDLAQEKASQSGAR